MTYIDKLETLDLREAWLHEAQDFTPWLSNNLDRLGEAIGLHLDIEETEVPVGSYYADIVATDPLGNRRVLIENQLERADHRHLGQIMTYLAGLKAEVVVWVAPDYSEPHLAAIEWLNKHTVEPFAFFAVRVRVVRIGQSAPASIFEVLQRPNDWERQVQSWTRQESNRSRRAGDRKDYWNMFLRRHPDMAELGMTINGASSQWLISDPDDEFVLSVYLSLDSVGVFLRGPRGMQAVEFNEKFHKVRDRFFELAGDDPYHGEKDSTSHPVTVLRLDMQDRENWEQAIDWQADRARKWLKAARQVLGKQ